MTVRDLSVPTTKIPAPPRGALPSYTRNSKPGVRDDTTIRRWAWQDIPVLQLPPVRTAPNLPPRPHEIRPRGLVAELESRILQVKQEEGVESVLRRAEEILRARKKSTLGRWANNERDFVRENRREPGAGAVCCRRREQEHAKKEAFALRSQRRKAAVCSRNERQRLLIASRGMANREVQRRKKIRDRAFAELVYRRIYTRTGGNARAWAVIVASVTRLQFMHAAVGMEARRAQEVLTAKSMDVVGRFLCRAIVKRRRIRAVQVIAGALGAFTNSNVISRFAGRVRWGAHRLQSAARQRAACTTDHLDLLSRHWDRLYPRHPPAIKKQERVREGSPSRTPPPAASSKPAASAESGGTRNSKRSPRKKGGGGGKTRTKADSKRQGVGASPGGKSPRDLSPGGTSPASKGKVKKADGGSELGNEVDRAARGISEEPGAVDAFGEAKKAEIVAWLQQARFKHSQERIIYERFTVFPLMVELLLQHEGETHRNRLQAIERATFLRSHGQLLHTWVDKGYYAKMAHVIPPPQRMPRLFSREEGDAMFERASAKAASTSAPVSSKQYDQD